MSSLVIAGDISGTVTLDAPAAAGSTVLTLPATSGTILTTGGGAAGSFTSLTNSGNLTFTGTGNRILGDFSNATIANRVTFQTSATNSATSVSAIPNGTALAADFFAFNSSDPSNSSILLMRAAATEVTIRSANTGTGTFLPMTFYTGGSERMRIDTSGNVGIGTSSPNPVGFGGTVLNVSSSSSSGGVAQLQTTAADAANNYAGSLVFAAISNTSGIRIAQIEAFTSGATANNRGGELTFNTKPNGGGLAERMRIDSSGNVGIGTNNPGGALTVARAGQAVMTLVAGSSSAEFVQSGGTDVARHVLSAGGQTPYVSSFDILQSSGGTALLQNRANAAITFATNDTERMRIDVSGNLLVGTTTSAITGSGFSVTTYANGRYIDIGHTTGDTGGDGYARFIRAGTIVGQITSNGTTQVSYATSSDYRLKENVAPMIGALETVAQLKPVTYKWKADGSDGQGFIAHELQAILPDAVTGEKDAVAEDGSIIPQGIDTSFLVATLTKAIQELNAKVEALEAQLGAAQ